MNRLETTHFDRVAVTLLPDVDVARNEREAIVIVKTAMNHGQLPFGDAMKDDLGVVNVTNAQASAGGWLHSGRAGVVSGNGVAVTGWTDSQGVFKVCA